MATKINKITLPYKFTPREYQLPLLRALDNGYKRGYCVWHRRSGKDKTFINYMAKEMMRRIGGYYYLLPTYKQGKKVIWNGRDKAGFKFTDHIPHELRMRTDNSEMLIELKKPPAMFTDDEKKRAAKGHKIPGSIFQVIGTDKIDSLMGANPIGCVFSEWALQNPAAWDYLRPILAENNGWAIFNTTPRGKNHGHSLLQTAEAYPDVWYSDVLTVEDTKAIPPDVLDQERKEMLRRDPTGALYEQEFMCSFEVPIQGAYYASQLQQAQDEGRITSVPYDMNIFVNTAWDLGIDDSMTIWFYQVAGKEIRFIDFITGTGEGINYYVQELNKKHYVYGEHYAPHDIKVRELGTGKSRLEVAKRLGIRFNVVPKLPILDGIQAGRNIFNRCWFDKDKCERGIDALMSYHKEYDEDNQVFKAKPEHDWSSHACLVADSIIKTRFGQKTIDKVNNNDEVLTPCGYFKVLNSGVVKFVDKLLIVKTNMSELRCTSGHKFFTNRGLVCADALRYNDLIWTIQKHKKLSLMALFLGYRKAVIILDQGLEVLKGSCIVKSGSFIMEKFLKGMLFIIKMVINLIIRLIIYFVYLGKIIINYILKSSIRKIFIGTKKLGLKIVSNMSGQKKILKGLNLYSLRLLKKLNYGIGLKRVKNGIKSMVRILGKIEKSLIRCVNIVEQFINHIILVDQDGVARVVKVEVEKVNNIPVYDLTVEKHHCYFANGLLVSNSDAFRYFAVSFKDILKSSQHSTVVNNNIIDDPYER
jgi:phage terminase large subunit